MRIPQRLEAERKARRLTRAKLAKLAGVSREHVGKIEKGLTNPTAVLLAQLCRAMQMKVTQFLGAMEDSGDVV